MGNNSEVKPIICYLHSTHGTLIYSHAILPSFSLLKALFPLTKDINKSAIHIVASGCDRVSELSGIGHLCDFRK